MPPLESLVGCASDVSGSLLTIATTGSGSGDRSGTTLRGAEFLVFDLTDSWIGLDLANSTFPIVTSSRMAAFPDLGFFFGELKSSLVFLAESGLRVASGAEACSLVSFLIVTSSLRVFPPVFSRIDVLLAIIRGGWFSSRPDPVFSESSFTENLRFVPALAGGAVVVFFFSTAGGSAACGFNCRGLTVGLRDSTLGCSWGIGFNGISLFFGEGELSMNGSALGDGNNSGDCILFLGLGLRFDGSGDLAGGDSTLAGSLSMNCDIGGGPSSGDSAESASERSASICSGLWNVSFM